MAAVPIKEIESLKRLCDDLFDAVYIVDASFNVLYVNPALRRQFRFRARPGSRCSDHFKLDICQGACVLEACRKNKSRAMWLETFTHATGEEPQAVQVGGSALVDAAGEVAGAIGIIRDISVELALHTKYRAQLDRERRAKEILEETVQERTLELRAVNREIRDIVDNIQQGIFTVGPDLTVNAQFSRRVEALFAGATIAGRAASELLWPRPQDAEARAKLDDWLRLVFAQPFLPWDVVGQLGERELVYLSATSGKRNLLLDYVPIRDESAILKLMVLVEDVTEKRALAAEIEQKTKENEADITQISDIIQLDPEIFEQFLAEAEQLVSTAREGAARLGETSGADPRKAVDELFRQIHTLKGNARSFKLSLISTRAHELENLLAAVREGTRQLDDELRGQIDLELVGLEELVRRAAQLREKVLRRKGPDLGQVRKDHRDATLPVKAGRLTALRAEVGALRQRLAAGEPLDAAALLALQAQLAALTHVPFARLSRRLIPMVADLARSLGKKLDPLVEVGAEGLELDVDVMNSLGDALIHALRNAVDHGVEPPAVRAEHGKPEVATIRLVVDRAHPEFMVIRVEDDGRGIDVDRVLAKARERGLVDARAAASASPEEIVDLVFLPGFSTSEVVSDVSGRGVGMDAVRASLGRVGGTVRLENRPGRGCTLELKVPNQVVVNGLTALGTP